MPRPNRPTIRGRGAEALFEQDHSPALQPVAPPAPPPLVKATFYFRPDQLERLEDLRYSRIKAGQKVDKSALMREALDDWKG